MTNANKFQTHKGVMTRQLHEKWDVAVHAYKRLFLGNHFAWNENYPDIYYMLEAVASSQIEGINIATPEEWTRFFMLCAGYDDKAYSVDNSPAGECAAAYFGQKKVEAHLRNYAPPAEQKTAFFTEDFVIALYQQIKQIPPLASANKVGFRVDKGTVIAKGREIIYRPPEPQEVPALMEKLYAYANAATPHPFLAMPQLHYHFESIHPFHDGNGRTGRALNSLFLGAQNWEGKKKILCLLMSGEIYRRRPEYYAALQAARGGVEGWRQYLLYMLAVVEQAAIRTDRFATELDNEVWLAKTNMEELSGNVRAFGKTSHETATSIFVSPMTTAKDFALKAHHKLNAGTEDAAERLLNLCAANGFLTRHPHHAHRFVYENKPLCALIQKWLPNRDGEHQHREHLNLMMTAHGLVMEQ